MKAFNLKWLSIFGGMLVVSLCNACDVNVFIALPVGISTGGFLFNLCEYYSPSPINITVKLEREK